MDSETRIWNTIGLIVTLLPTIALVYIPYDTYIKEDIEEIKIEMYKSSIINPLGDLSGFGGRVELLLNIEDNTHDNISIGWFSLKNVGSMPVKAEDFHEPLSVNVVPPWEIIAVENELYPFEQITLIWKRESPNRFVARPFLFNPGDSIRQKIYLTNTDAKESENLRNKNILKIDIDIKARILNMKRFSKHISISDRIKRPEAYP